MEQIRTKSKKFMPQRMDSEKRDCLMCNAPNKICDMVQCDKCKLWAHYSCAGVTEVVKEQDWNCNKCSNALQVPKPRKPDAKNKTGQKSNSNAGSGTVSKSNAGSSVGSVSESAETLEESLKRMEKEQRAKEQAIEEEMVLREKRLEMEKALQEKRRQKEKAFRKKQLQQDRELKERQLQEERDAGGKVSRGSSLSRPAQEDV